MPRTYIPASGVIIDKKNGKVHILNPGPLKNIAEGYYDQFGFHPIRASKDYDADRADEFKEYDSRMTPARKKFLAKKNKKKATTKKRTAKKRTRNPFPLEQQYYVVKQDGKGTVSTHKTKAAARKKWNALVKAWSKRTGQSRTTGLVPYWIE